jgi:aminoglycoside/choline kinase family phosphotransferase
MQPTPRDQLVSDWVASRFPDQSVQITTASADASFRRYFRLTWPDGTTRILMDAPPDKEDCKPFIHVAGLLAKADLAAPRILDKDLDNGFLVLTDLGRIGYLDALNADLSLADMLIRPVLDVLVKWQLSSTAATLPPYDATLLRRELDLFPEWFIRRHLGVELDDNDMGMLDRTFKFLINSALSQPKVFVHRDFMPRNLMVVESAERLTPGIIDFQDAVSARSPTTSSRCSATPSSPGKKSRKSTGSFATGKRRAPPACRYARISAPSGATTN